MSGATIRGVVAASESAYGSLCGGVAQLGVKGGGPVSIPTASQDEDKKSVGHRTYFLKVLIPPALIQTSHCSRFQSSIFNLKI